MTSGPKTCSLLISDLRSTADKKSFTIEVPMEDNWIFFVILKDEETLNLYTESDEILMTFKFTADIPLKILWKVRNYLISRSDIMEIPSLEDKILDQYADTVIHLNYNISVDCNISDYQSMHYFHKWLNTTLLQGIKRSRKTCSLFIRDLSTTEGYFTVEVPLEDNWFLLIKLKNKETLNLYSESANILLDFNFTVDIPLKILWKVRKYLISHSNIIKIPPLEDMILDQFCGTANDLNYNISTDYNISSSQTKYNFHKWINKTLLKGIQRSTAERRLYKLILTERPIIRTGFDKFFKTAFEIENIRGS